MKKIFLLLALFLLLPASSQAWSPNKDVTVIVAYKAGSGTDTGARLLAQYARKYVGQTLVINNLPGGDGKIGWTELARSKPDGYTIGFINLPCRALCPLPTISPKPALWSSRPIVPGRRSTILLLPAVNQISTVVPRTASRPPTTRQHNFWPNQPNSPTRPFPTEAQPISSLPCARVKYIFPAPRWPM